MKEDILGMMVLGSSGWLLSYVAMATGNMATASLMRMTTVLSCVALAFSVVAAIVSWLATTLGPGLDRIERILRIVS